MSVGSLFVLDGLYLYEVAMSDVKRLVSESVEEKVRSFASEAVKAFDGVELVDVSFYKQYGKLNIEAFLWKKEGISLNDCESVHNVLSDMLDSIEGDFADDYILNVSSSGLDRKIVTDDDFRRAIDTEVECVDSQKNKTHHGTLISYDSEHIVLKTDGKKPKEIVLQRNLLTKVQPYIRF